MLTVGSLFTGIGGLDLGLERAGMRVVWQCEADAWRRGILARHWPHVACGTDVREWARDGDEHCGRDSGGERCGNSTAGGPGERTGFPDLICGGFPCQDLSVAGRRAGLHAGARSSLFFEFARIADTLRPRWLLIENVPGLLSSHRGRDFAVVLATLAEIGYGVAWRVLDSRYFGVAQRRRRVFIVGYLGASGPEPFLPFLEGGARDSEASGEEGQDAAVASLCGIGSGGADDNDAQANRMVNAIVTGGTDASTSKADAAATLRELRREVGEEVFAEWQLGILDSLLASEVLRPEMHGQGIQWARENLESIVVGCACESEKDQAARAMRNLREAQRRGASHQRRLARQLTEQLAAHLSELPQHGASVGLSPSRVQGPGVRRLTVVECARLQGFPDDWFGEPNEPPDSPKYAAIGDAVTVNVAEWIGRRIIEAELKSLRDKP